MWISFDTTVFRIQQILLYLENNKYKEEKHPALPFSCVISAEIVNVFLPFLFYISGEWKNQVCPVNQV